MEECMDRVISFLKANRTVFLATSDKGQARVRPFQFQFEEAGRLWFCTAKSKEVYAQLTADARLEFACTSPDMVTLRVKGEANLDDDMGVKRRIIEENPPIRGIYGTADNPMFTVFSVDHGSAYMFDFSPNPPITVLF
jgi:uncharacterized pyridoxamine 5'-phosphate oxidase family protein